MSISEEQIQALALKAYPKEICNTGGCSGLKAKDLYQYERQIWIEGFKAAILTLSNKDSQQYI